MADQSRKYAIRNSYGYTEYLTAQAIENLREMGETVEVIDPAWGEGSTWYDRGARADHEPQGGRGWANLREGTGHSTQHYDDGYHLSRNTDGQNDDRIHWTDQSIPKGKRKFSRRHKPPPDAR